MNRSFIKSAVLGLAVAVAALALLAFVGALALEKTSDPDKLITPVAFAALAVASTAGGAVAARKDGAGLAASALCGVMLSVIHLALNLAFDGRLRVLLLVATYAALVFLSLLGGLLFGNRRSHSASKKLRRLRKRSRGAK